MKSVKTKIILTIILMLTGLCIWLAIYSIQPLWWSFREFIEPTVNERLVREWENKPSEFLLKQINSNYYLYFGIASGILVERNETKAINILGRVLNSKHKDSQIRVYAANALAEFNNPGANAILMDIVKGGRGNPNYLDVMAALSTKHNNEIYPEILKMARDNYHTSYAVDMLKYYPEKPETIEALIKIASLDPEKYIRDKARDALEKIRKSEKPGTVHKVPPQ